MGGLDNRSQSTVLGAILLFAILILALGIVQVYIVPNQNAQAELNHLTEVDNDFAELHSGLMNAAGENGEFTTSIKLGLEYPARLVSVNPGSPHGTLSTAELGPYDGEVPNSSDTVGEVCGLDGTYPNQSLVYEPDYNQLDNADSYGYENTITYKGNNGDFTSYNQLLLRGNVMRLRPLTGVSISISSTQRQSISFFAGETGRAEIPKNKNLTIPTRLKKPQWEEIAATNPEVSVNNYDNSTGEVTLNFDDDFTLLCTPIGVNSKPNNNPSKPVVNNPNQDIINPIGPGALELDSVATSNKNSTVTFFSNTNTSTVTEVRVASISSSGNNEPDEIKLTRNGNSTTVIVGGKFGSVDWFWSGGGGGSGYGDVYVAPSTGTYNPNTQITVQFKFADGTIGTYIIEVTN